MDKFIQIMYYLLVVGGDVKNPDDDDERPILKPETNETREMCDLLVSRGLLEKLVDKDFPQFPCYRLVMTGITGF